MIACGFIPFLWGLLEATCFFLVPDIWLTFLACSSKNKRLLSYAILWCVLGAVIGGIIMFFAAQYQGDKILIFLDHIPGISKGMIHQAQEMLSETGLFSLFAGIFQGIPYKIFASEWSLLKGGIWPFIWVSIAARGARFVFAVILTRLIYSFLESRVSHGAIIKYVLWFLFWSVFYSFYFIRYGI